MCPAAARPCCDDAAHRALDDRPVGTEQRGVEVALHRPRPGRAGAPPRPAAPASRRRRRRRRPCASTASSSPVPTPKWMRGTRAGQRLEHRSAVRQHELLVVGQRQRAGPRVEQLDRRGAGLDLHLQELAGDVGQPAEQRVPQLGLAVHERLGAGVVLRRAALDQVARQRERRAGEADQRRRAELGRPACARPRVTYGHVAGLERRAAGRGRPRSRIGCVDHRARRRARCRCRRPIATSGTTMSEKKIAASTPCRRTGCRVISVIRSGVRQASSIDVPARSARYSGSERPAWRMNHTGGCGAGAAAWRRARAGSRRRRSDVGVRRAGRCHRSHGPTRPPPRRPPGVIVTPACPQPPRDAGVPGAPATLRSSVRFHGESTGCGTPSEGGRRDDRC